MPAFVSVPKNRATVLTDMEQVKLDRLLISEISGVDDPANMLPGFMVTKAADEETTKAEAPGTLAKIKGILSLGASPQQEGLDMDRDELTEVLTETNKSLVEAVAEAVAKSVAPAEGESKPEATPEPAVPALTIEDVAKTVADAIEEHVVKQYNEIFEKVLDRVEKIEENLGIAARKSLDGQEAATTEPVEKSTPDLADAIEKALRRPSRG